MRKNSNILLDYNSISIKNIRQRTILLPPPHCKQQKSTPETTSQYRKLANFAFKKKQPMKSTTYSQY